MTKLKHRTQNGYVAPRTLERRTVLEWFGSAAVLGLSSPLLTACMQENDTDNESNTDGIDGTDSEDDISTDTESTEDTHSGIDFNGTEFAPGNGHPTLDEFVVFTVDEQNLTDILASWKLQVDGLVENPITLSFGDLLNMSPRRQTTDFHCVTGWSVFDVPWVGIPVAALMQLVTPLETATHVTYHCNGDVYSESTPLSESLEPNTILAYGVGDSTLPLDHGFPLRLIIPRKLGYKNAKYIYRMELTNEAHWGYWEQRGYPYEADVPESRLREGKY